MEPLDLLHQVGGVLDGLLVADQDGGLVEGPDQLGQADVVPLGERRRLGRDAPDVAPAGELLGQQDVGRQVVLLAQLLGQGQGLAGGVGAAEGVGQDHERPVLLGQHVRLDRPGGQRPDRLDLLGRTGAGSSELLGRTSAVGRGGAGGAGAGPECWRGPRSGRPWPGPAVAAAEEPRHLGVGVGTSRLAATAAAIGVLMGDPHPWVRVIGRAVPVAVRARWVWCSGDVRAGL